MGSLKSGLGRGRFVVSIRPRDCPQTPSHENMGQNDAILHKKKTSFNVSNARSNTMPGAVKFMCTIRVFFPRISSTFGVPSVTVTAPTTGMLAFSASRTPRHRHDDARKRLKVQKKERNLRFRA